MSTAVALVAPVDLEPRFQPTSTELPATGETVTSITFPTRRLGDRALVGAADEPDIESVLDEGLQPVAGKCEVYTNEDCIGGGTCKAHGCVRTN